MPKGNAFKVIWIKAINLFNFFQNPRISYCVSSSNKLLLTKSKVFAPVNGGSLEFNEALEMDPTIINKDCYGEGWMYKIKPNDMGEVENLIHGTAAVEKWLLADIEKYKQD